MKKRIIFLAMLCTAHIQSVDENKTNEEKKIDISALLDRAHTYCVKLVDDIRENPDVCAAGGIVGSLLTAIIYKRFKSNQLHRNMNELLRILRTTNKSL